MMIQIKEEIQPIITQKVMKYCLLFCASSSDDTRQNYNFNILRNVF